MLLRPLGFETQDGLDGVSKVLLNEHEKGFRNGLLFAINLPEMMVESLEEMVEELSRDMEDEDE